MEVVTVGCQIIRVVWVEFKACCRFLLHHFWKNLSYQGQGLLFLLEFEFELLDTTLSITGMLPGQSKKRFSWWGGIGMVLVATLLNS